MRILANVTKKLGMPNYSSECFTATVECDVDMGIDQVGEAVDALFAEARSAVQRQIQTSESNTNPTTDIPQDNNNTRGSETPKDSPKGNGHPITEKQKSMIFRLLKENFDDSSEERFLLREQTNIDRVNDLSRKQASRVIEKLLDRSRAAA